MPHFINRLRAVDPSYRIHRASGQPVVTLRRQDFYLGKHKSPESQAKYYRLLGEWNAAGRPAVWSLVSPEDITIVEVPARYFEFAQGHYGDSLELSNIKLTLSSLKKFYGFTKPLSSARLP